MGDAELGALASDEAGPRGRSASVIHLIVRDLLLAGPHAPRNVQHRLGYPGNLTIIGGNPIDGEAIPRMDFPLTSP